MNQIRGIQVGTNTSHNMNYVRATEDRVMRSSAVVWLVTPCDEVILHLVSINIAIYYKNIVQYIM